MSDGPIRHTASLPLGFVATFTWTGEGEPMSIEWKPTVPRIHSPRHRRRFIAAYEQARREFMRDVATTIGGSVLVADLTGRTELVQPATKN
jgi:hypothetical protein